MKHRLIEPTLSRELVNWKVEKIYNFYSQRKKQEEQGIFEETKENENIVLDVTGVDTSKEKEKVEVIYNSKFTFEEYLKENDLNFSIDPSLLESSASDFIAAKRKQRLQEIVEESKEFEEDLNIRNNNLTNFNISDNHEEVLLTSEKNHFYNKPNVQKSLKLLVSTMLGAGTGLAMLPIFNDSVRELENFGIDIHDKDALFISSTINTGVIYSAINILLVYHFINDHKKEAEDFVDVDNSRIKYLKKAVLPLSILGSTTPLSLLWKTELENQNFTGEDGFNAFIAWATFTTLPLVICKTIENYETILTTIESYKTKHIELDSLGSKIFTYGTTLLSFIGRGIAYTSLSKFMFKEIGFDEDEAIVFSSIIGGLLMNSIKGATEFHNLQSLFDKTLHQNNYMDYVKGIFSIIEASWFALPITAVGIDAMKDYNTFLKAMLFTPLFLSTMIAEANTIYETIHTEHKVKFKEHPTSIDINVNDDALEVSLIGQEESID